MAPVCSPQWYAFLFLVSNRRQDDLERNIQRYWIVFLSIQLNGLIRHIDGSPGKLSPIAPVAANGLAHLPSSSFFNQQCFGICSSSAVQGFGSLFRYQ